MLRSLILKRVSIRVGGLCTSAATCASSLLVVTVRCSMYTWRPVTAVEICSPISPLGAEKLAPRAPAVADCSRYGPHVPAHCVPPPPSYTVTCCTLPAPLPRATQSKRSFDETRYSPLLCAFPMTV